MHEKQIVICPSCSSEMILRHTTKFTYKNGKPRKFYGCSKYPECREIHGASPDGLPLGIPAKKKIRVLRHEVHEIADRLWNWDNRRERGRMYKWLSNHTKSQHIAMMDEEELLSTKEALLDLLEKNGLTL